MENFTGCKNYTLLEKEELSDVNITAYTLRHDKTGARVVLLSNDDENKTFIIGFKTPQENSTGVPHILEHSVLCGSEKYPVKDAMTEVGKGSLNTFMNAFTYPDRTLYPVASCNDKDFQNLMSVYLDAVFHPRVLWEEKIFLQEGWHYEMESVDSPLTINGVVYNEMKGVYSSPEQALSSYIMFSLFPDTQYGVESGGDPDEIPNLTYEEFCAFYKKLYHPSNSRIFLYGNMDFEEKLEFIDKEYLSKYEAIVPDSEVKLQAPFDKPKRIEKEYAISENEDEKDATFLSYNVVCSDYTDVKTTGVMNAINYALCSVPGAKLKERLIDAGIGKDVYSEFTTETCQKFFSIIAQDANPEDEDRFVKIIEDTIREIVSEGFDKKTLEASIVSSEFSYREADFGYYPKGISYGSMTFEDWLYSDEDIFSYLKQNSVFKELREGIDEGLFEKVLKEKVLENNHKTILIMKPKKGLSDEKEEALTAKLKEYKDSLSEKEKKNIVKSTKNLKKYQEEEDSPEALKTIPTLSIKDIRKNVIPCKYKVEKVSGTDEVYTDVNTNGIVYFSLGFSVDKVPKRLLPALSIVKTLLGYVDTESYTYGDLINECNIKTGNLFTTVSMYGSYYDSDEYTADFEVRCKALYENIPDSFKLIKEILFTSKLDDKKRVKENLEQSKVRIQGFMMQSGHAVSIGSSSAAVSDSGQFSEIMNGMVQYRYIEEILKDYDNEFPTLYNDMKEVLSIILVKDNLEVNLGCDKKGRALFEKALSEFIIGLNEKAPQCEVEHVMKTGKSTAYSCSSLVQFAAVSGNYTKNSDLKYKGSLQVLRNILNTDYLWTEVRLKGGAYGCFSAFRTNGEVSMGSFRDPNLKKTYKIYRNAIKYLKNFPGSDEDVERYIITSIGEYDTPLSPSMKTSKSFSFYKNKITDEVKQKERDEILATTKEEIKSLYQYLEKAFKKPAYSCVGGEKILSSEGTMFDEILPLSKG